MKKLRPRLISGKTVEDWDQSWVEVEGGLMRYQPGQRHKVGSIGFP